MRKAVGSLVALRKESVDRNIPPNPTSQTSSVALRKESVDRNLCCVGFCLGAKVALRKESVDRNGMEINGVSYDVWSLSARRAWIEIGRPTTRTPDQYRVALRKESVDRNNAVQIVIVVVYVALRKESVDRNSCWLLA